MPSRPTPSWNWFCRAVRPRRFCCGLIATARGVDQDKHGKALPVIGRGVQEIRVADNKEAYRVIYVASIGTRVWVLHAFHKKSKQGIETQKSDIELVRRR